MGALGNAAAAQPRDPGPPDEGRFHTLIVPGGRATLDALGVPPELPRALVLTELVRRLHFMNDRAAALETAVRGLPGPSVSSIVLPLPLSEQTWRRVVFRRDIPAAQLFAAILNEPRARLLYHGLMGLDAGTRRWLGARPDLIEDIHRSDAAVRAFALFSPALRVRGDTLVVPGGDLAVRRWEALLDAEVSRPDRFVRRLFSREDGRLAGLYFTLATVDPVRRSLLLGPPADAAERFAGLARRFVACYASEMAVYPFGARFSDPVLLMLELELTTEGQLAGPVWRRFWARAMEGDGLPGDPARELRGVSEDGAIDVESLVAAVCEAPPDLRPVVFETLLFAQRVFPLAADADLPDVLLAVRARRLYPAAMIALEQAGITAPATYARVARAAGRLARLEDPRQAISALQQFQGALAVTLRAIRSGTVAGAQVHALLEALADVPFEGGRYGGRLARWFVTEWPALTGVMRETASGERPLEVVVADALAGPRGRGDAVAWEGLDYVLDLPGEIRRQVLEARRRQGGATLDSVRTLITVSSALRAPGLTLDQVVAARTRLVALGTELAGFQPAAEFPGDMPNVARRVENAADQLRRIDAPRRLSRARDVAGDLEPLVDLVFGQVMTAWAYAPHLGEGASQTLGTGGDLHVRHEFGVRLPGRARLMQRWEIAWPLDAAGGNVGGALLGLDVSLARRALRRIQSDRLPREPALAGIDVVAMQVSVALLDPRRLTDAVRDGIAAALAAGRAAVVAAGRDAAALETLSHAAGSSTWRTQAIGWTAAEEPERLQAWFATAELAWIGGLDPESADDWGTAFRPPGCLCLRMPRVRPPDILMGRTLAAILPHLSPGLMLRIADVLARHRLPAPLAASVQRYAMREVIDRVAPAHAADLLAFSLAIDKIDRARIEDYIGAVAASGPLAEAVADQR